MAYSPPGMPAVSQPLRRNGQAIPDRLYIVAPGMKRTETKRLAEITAQISRKISPKLSGRAAEGIMPYYGDGFFGVKWDRPYLWHQEAGTRPFTMRNLAGKVIHMWIDDPTGEEARKNPKAKTRMTATGRRQVLIFRKAARFGQRKRVAVRDSQGRLVRWRDVPASYPGAPGRIASRGTEDLPTGGQRMTGRIVSMGVRPHVGVRWRHPGIVPREFMQYSMQSVASAARIPDLSVYAVYKKR